jgi:hypothetical protein
MDPVTASVGDASEFLDVDMDEFAAAVRFDASDHASGWPIDPGQSVEAVTDKNAVHGRGGDIHDASEAGGSESLGTADRNDALFEFGRGLVRARVRSR